jgi:hypothetical protein
MKHKPRRYARSKVISLAAAATVAVIAAGLAAAQAGPASADPIQVFTAVGSENLQGVENAFEADEGDNLIGSWNATNPNTGAVHEVITPNNAAAGQCSFTRPDGTKEGLEALLYSIDPASAPPQLTEPPGLNCIDWSRDYFIGPGTQQANDGSIIYIPFALDAIAGATSSATALVTANDFTLMDLQTLYASCQNVTEGGVTYNPNGTATGGQVPIDLYVPQTGSEILGPWADALGFSSTVLPPCVHQTILAGPDAGQPVEENDGTAVTSDPNGYMPYSVAQWAAQRNGYLPDTRHSAVLDDLNGTSPFNNGSAVTGIVNVSFPITGEVYNVVPFLEASTNTVLASLLVGSGSLLCRDVPTVEVHYGYAQLGASTLNTCGATADSLRAVTPWLIVESNVSLPAGGFVSQAADCPAGTVVVGGGAQVVGTGAASPGTEIQESAPESTGSGTSTTYAWQAAVSNTSTSNYTLGVFAVCGPAPSGYQIVENPVSLAGGGFVRTTADCPSGTVVLGGGAQVTPAGSSNVDTEMQESSPGTASGVSLWLAAVSNHSTSNYTLGIYAVCGTAPSGYQVAETNVTLAAGGSVNQDAACPTGTIVLGGGAAVIGAGSANFGTELLESAPAIPGVTGGVSTNWVVAASNGSATSYTFGLFAVCVSP